MGEWAARTEDGTSRAKKELCATTSKKRSSRRVFSRGAVTSPDIAKPRGNGLLLTPNSQAHASDLGKQKAGSTICH